MNKYHVNYTTSPDDIRMKSSYIRFYSMVEATSKEAAIDKFLNKINDSSIDFRIKDYPPLTIKNIDDVALFYESKADGLQYLLYEDGTAHLAGAASKSDDSDFTELIIPDVINVNDKEYRITTIHKYAFESYKYLKKVHFPKWLTMIECYSFRCTGLEEVVINNVSEIDPEAFSACEIKRFFLNTSMSLEQISEVLERIDPPMMDVTICSTKRDPYIFDLIEWASYCDDEFLFDESPQLTIIYDGTITLKLDEECDLYELRPRISFKRLSNQIDDIELELNQDDDLSDLDI